jgi:hypothetical protein
MKLDTAGNTLAAAAELKRAGRIQLIMKTRAQDGLAER